MIPKRAAKRQRGLATIEFIIVAPLLLLLIMAVSEFSHALQQYNTLTKSVRVGARYAAGEAAVGSTGVPQLDGVWVAGAKNLTVFGNLVGSGEPLLPALGPANVAVALPDSDHVTVSASYVYRPIFARIPTFGLREGPIVPNFTFHATVTMRVL
jgi:hypothetical protein